VLDDERSDAALLAATAGGDDDAFGVLVQRYVRRTTLLAAQSLGSRADAEDVAQDAFIVAHQNARRFDAGRPFAPWFFAIVRRLASNRRSRELRRQRLLQFWGWMTWSHPAASRPETVLIARLDAATATRAAKRLSPMQRSCFDLVEIRGLSIEEVAEMFAISESTVRQHVFRARAILRSRLEGEASIPGADHDE